MSKLKRSKFNLSHYHLLTADMGKLIPVGVVDCLPGDTFSMNTNSFIRLAPMLAPVMHPIKVRIHHWFVPYRLLWTDFPDFITGGDNGLAKPAFPQINIPKPANKADLLNSIHDYFGLPIDSLQTDINISALPYRAYNLIWNNFYRDEDLQDEVPISYDSGADTLTHQGLKNVSWNKDYFTTARPWTQKGPEIGVPVFSSGGEVKQYRVAEFQFVNYGNPTQEPDEVMVSCNPNWATEIAKYKDKQTYIDWLNTGKNWSASGKTVGSVRIGEYSGAGRRWGLSCQIKYLGYTIKESTAPVESSITINGDVDSVFACRTGAYAGTNGSKRVTVLVTVADGSSSTGYLNLNDLRLASSLQRFQEARAKWGSRYVEYLQYYGINPSDKRLQLPEYLGGGKSTIQISEVLQTSPDQDSYVGDMYGHGISSMKTNRFRYFCEEHGIILSLMSIVPDNIYQDGIDRFWLKDTREELYTRELANIGMQSVYRGEIFPIDKNLIKEPFGYQDRYNEYRHMFSKIHGDFRQTLDYWHLARKFSRQPNLNDEFLKCEPSKRIFAEQTSQEFYIMLYHSILAKRCMPKKAKTFLK